MSFIMILLVNFSTCWISFLSDLLIKNQNFPGIIITLSSIGGELIRKSQRTNESVLINLRRAAAYDLQFIAGGFPLLFLPRSAF